MKPLYPWELTPAGRISLFWLAYDMQPMATLRILLEHWVLRALSRAELIAGRSIETANSSGVLWSTDIGGGSYLLQRLFYKVWFELSEPTDSGKVAGDESVVDVGLLGPMSVV